MHPCNAPDNLTFTVLYKTVTPRRGGADGRAHMFALDEAGSLLPSEEGTSSNICRAFTLKPGPEPGLDGLICVMTVSHCLSDLRWTVLYLPRLRGFSGTKLLGWSCQPRGHYLAQSIFQVSFQKSIPTHICQLILYVDNRKGYVDEFVGELTSAKRLGKSFV